MSGALDKYSNTSKSFQEWRNAQELSQMGMAEKSKNSPTEAPQQLMGATGPLVLIQDPNATKPSRKVSEPAISTAFPDNNPNRPERRSVRRKPPGPGSPAGVNGGPETPSLTPPGEIRRADSRISISQMSMGGRPDLEVPELSYGINTRMPSASVGIDLRFAPERGRFFVATQDLLPGTITNIVSTNILQYSQGYRQLELTPSSQIGFYPIFK